jgi:hypothetical protein
MADAAANRVRFAGLRVGTGTVATGKSGSTCTVSVGSSTVTMQVARDLTIAVGDIVVFARQGSAWWVLQRLYAAAPTPPPPPVTPPEPPPKPSTTSGTLQCSPVETRSYRPNFGWRSDNTNVYEGEYGGWGNHKGCAFYGTKPKSLSGATVTSASVSVLRTSGGAYASVTGQLVKITEATRPSGAPTVSGGTSVTLPAVGSSATITVPTAYAQALVDGTVGGLGLYVAGGSPYAITAGTAVWGSAWNLTINWTRS